MLYKLFSLSFFMKFVCGRLSLLLTRWRLGTCGPHSYVLRRNDWRIRLSDFKPRILKLSGTSLPLRIKVEILWTRSAPLRRRTRALVAGWASRAEGGYGQVIVGGSGRLGAHRHIGARSEKHEGLSREGGDCHADWCGSSLLAFC